MLSDILDDISTDCLALSIHPCAGCGTTCFGDAFPTCCDTFADVMSRQALRSFTCRYSFTSCLIREVTSAILREMALCH